MDLLKKNSVTFPEQMRVNDQGAWPFWYPLIPYPYHDTDILNGGTGLLGIKIPAGEIRNIFITLEQDTAFRLINLKYTVFEAAVPKDLNGVITTAIGSANVTGVTAAPLTGTISIGIGNTAVVGVGTLFTAELSVGQTIVYTDDLAVEQFGKIQAITDNLNLVLETAAPSAATLKTFQISTLFLTELTAGDVITWLDDGGVRRFGTVLNIVDNLNLVLAANALSVTTELTYKNSDYIGFITTVPGDTSVVGTGTSFLTDAPAGSQIMWTNDSGQVEIGTVADVTNDLLLTLEQPAELVTTQASYDSIMYSWYDNVIGTPPLLNTLKFIPLTKRVRVGVNLPSLQGRYIYGGTQAYLRGGGFEERPRVIGSIQGAKDGVGTIRTASLLPHEGSINVRVFNEHNQPIYINGVAFGYKVTLGGNK